MSDSTDPVERQVPRIVATRFQAGRHYITLRADATLESLPGGITAAADLVTRHMAGDWGDALCDEDKDSNDRAVRDGGRILSAYTLQDGTKVWIITEADRSATTLLLPEEY